MFKTKWDNFHPGPVETPSGWGLPISIQDLYRHLPFCLHLMKHMPSASSKFDFFKFWSRCSLEFLREEKETAFIQNVGQSWFDSSRLIVAINVTFLIGEKNFGISGPKNLQTASPPRLGWLVYNPTWRWGTCIINKTYRSAFATIKTTFKEEFQKKNSYETKLNSSLVVSLWPGNWYSSLRLCCC